MIRTPFAAVLAGVALSLSAIASPLCESVDVLVSGGTLDAVRAAVGIDFLKNSAAPPARHPHLRHRFRRLQNHGHCQTGRRQRKLHYG